MRILVTGSAGHLGEGLVRVLREAGHDVVGLDLLTSPFTDVVGSVTDRGLVASAVEGADAVLHAATLHKPHVVTHSQQAFVDTNVTGTLQLLEESVARGVGVFVFTSTTSVFGHALRGTPERTAWITEDVTPVPKNIYGATKQSAEVLCELFHRRDGLPCLVLRTSRFFPEEDDDAQRRADYSDENLKLNELLHRRADLEDVVSAHVRALERAPELGFGRYIVSATTPFADEDAAELAADAPAVLARRCPEYVDLYAERGWRMFPRLDRVYDNGRARRDLGWAPRFDFRRALARLADGRPPGSELAAAVGSKPYHAETFADGPYPVEEPRP